MEAAYHGGMVAVCHGAAQDKDAEDLGHRLLSFCGNRLTTCSMFPDTD
jgi:hypothetical protein